MQTTHSRNSSNSAKLLLDALLEYLIIQFPNNASTTHTPQPSQSTPTQQPSYAPIYTPSVVDTFVYLNHHSSPTTQPIISPQMCLTYPCISQSINTQPLNILTHTFIAPPPLPLIGDISHIGPRHRPIIPAENASDSLSDFIL